MQSAMCHAYTITKVVRKTCVTQYKQVTEVIPYLNQRVCQVRNDSRRQWPHKGSGALCHVTDASRLQFTIVHAKTSVGCGNST